MINRSILLLVGWTDQAVAKEACQDWLEDSVKKKRGVPMRNARRHYVSALSALTGMSSLFVPIYFCEYKTISTTFAQRVYSTCTY